MVNSILNAVTKQLGTTFGNSYRYYVENVQQELRKPCFTIDLLMPTQRSKSPVLYERTMPMVIHYFSGSKTDNKNDSYAMGERAIEALEYLPFKGVLLRGEDISWQMVDDVLQIFVTYRFTTRMDTKTEESMSEMVKTVAHTN